MRHRLGCVTLNEAGLMGHMASIDEVGDLVAVRQDFSNAPQQILK